MEELIKTIEKNKRLFLLIVAAAMFVLLAVCPALDVAGKATANGLKVLFKGSGLGFPRFVMLLMLAVPLVVIAHQFVDLKLKGAVKDHFDLACFAAAIALFVLFALCLSEGLSAATGAYLYLVFGAIGLAGCFLTKPGRK